MRNYKNLVILQEIDSVAMHAKLVCDCGCDKFTISHSGKVTSGFLRPYIIKRNNQLLINARCDKCQEVIAVFDTKLDGKKVCDNPHDNLQEFTHKGDKVFSIELEYNFMEEHYLSDQFEEIFIIAKKNNGKEIIIYE